MKRYNVLQIIWFIVVVIIFGLLCTLGFIYKNKVNDYKDYEVKLINASKLYLKDKSSFPNKNEKKVINIDKLIGKGYIKKKDVIKECTGKIIVTFEKSLDYKPQLKCKYYKSTSK